MARRPRNRSNIGPGTAARSAAGGTRLDDPLAAEILNSMISVAPSIIEKGIKEDRMSINKWADFLIADVVFGDDLHQITLSPIGIIHLYRQYFFEFETFLGPAVGHIWISPGGTVELFETTRKRELTEQETRTSTELTLRRESSMTIQEDLSTLVKDDNSRNENLGVTVSAGGGLGSIFHADASLEYGLQTTNQRAEETAHKNMRQQSEKLSSEIKRSFQTTFKTTVETEDISSKRHVIQNTTTELKNFELRRKMRRIGVQVQHIGTTLCWQVYIDDPGGELGVAQLVHMAKPADLSALISPENPEPLKPIEQEPVIEFPWTPTPDPGSDSTDLNKLYNDYGDGRARALDEGESYFIFNTKEYPLQSPGVKFKLAPIGIYTVERTGENLPHVDPIFEIADNGFDTPSRTQPIGTAAIRVKMKTINFAGNPKVRLKLKVAWVPTDPFNQEVVNQKRMEHDAEKTRREREAYFSAVKERITLSSNIDKRPSDVLRKEERIVVYRKLIARLLGTKNDNPVQDRPTMHTISELIKTMFDVDRMLYFVAPDWWIPRKRESMQRVEKSENVPPTTITQNDLVDWSGAQERDRDNYLVTEDSAPAEMGSSIGWVLQLDGDEHRNAFLNSPWIKAVIPIRPGMEQQAMSWLESRIVEGSEDLRITEYRARDRRSFRDTDGDGQITLYEVITQLSEEVKTMNEDQNVMKETEKVFEKGFDPLQDAFRWKGDKFKVFDQWTEILPTDQVVAVEYRPADT